MAILFSPPIILQPRPELNFFPVFTANGESKDGQQVTTQENVTGVILDAPLDIEDGPDGCHLRE